MEEGKRMEDWKVVRKEEDWKIGRGEEDGRMEGCKKRGRMEGWKNGRGWKGEWKMEDGSDGWVNGRLEDWKYWRKYG